MEWWIWNACGGICSGIPCRGGVAPVVASVVRYGGNDRSKYQSLGGMRKDVYGSLGQQQGAFSSLTSGPTNISKVYCGAERHGNLLHYFPKKVIMEQRKKNSDRTSGDPVDTRRCDRSGLRSVKWTTGHVLVESQAARGKWVTGNRKESHNIRQKSRIGTWNVRGLLQPGKMEIVEREMESYRLDVLGVSETHWRGSGHTKTSSGKCVYFNGPDNSSTGGVAIIVPPRLNDSVIGYKAAGERIIHLRLQAHPCILNIIQAYAPTATADEDVLEEFYGHLETVTKNIPRKEIILILGDFNAKIGNTSHDGHLRSVVGGGLELAIEMTEGRD